MPPERNVQLVQISSDSAKKTRLALANQIKSLFEKSSGAPTRTRTADLLITKHGTILLRTLARRCNTMHPSPYFHGSNSASRIAARYDALRAKATRDV
jgi:hypothetical protein